MQYNIQNIIFTWFEIIWLNMYQYRTQTFTNLTNIFWKVFFVSATQNIYLSETRVPSGYQYCILSIMLPQSFGKFSRISFWNISTISSIVGWFGEITTDQMFLFWGNTRSLWRKIYCKHHFLHCVIIGQFLILRTCKDQCVPLSQDLIIFYIIRK